MVATEINLCRNCCICLGGAECRSIRSHDVARLLPISDLSWGATLTPPGDSNIDLPWSIPL